MAPPLSLRVLVDAERCEGHALCLGLAPEVFALTDAETACCDEHPDHTLLREISAAAAACPRQAITIQRHDPATIVEDKS